MLLIIFFKYCIFK